MDLGKPQTSSQEFCLDIINIKEWMLINILRGFFSIFTAVVLLFSTASIAQTGRQQLDTFLNQLSGYQAEFEQHLLDENLRLIEQAKGTVYLQRPGQMRWEYRSPLPQIIVADGKRLWIYDPELAQVTSRDQAQGLGSTPASLLSSEAPVEDRFTVKEIGARDDGSTWVGLSPKETETTFRDIRLGFKDNILTAMEFTDYLDQTTRLVFHAPSRNPAFAASFFQFEVPQGVDVIESQ